MQIRAKLLHGEIAYGELIEPELTPMEALGYAVASRDMHAIAKAFAALETGGAN